MAHKRFPDRLAFILNNPIRRRIHPPEELISKLDVESDDVVLDFGCGPGFYTIRIARIAGRTVGIDISTRMLQKAVRYASREGAAIEVSQSDGTEIKLAGETINLILLAHVFHEIEEKPRVLREFLRILKPSGRLAVVERTTGNGFLSGRFGPPVIKADELVLEAERAGFKFARTIPHRKDSIFIFRKPPVYVT